MEKTVKVTRKDLKRPDDFQQTGFKALQYLKTRIRWVWGIAGGLVAIAIAGLLFAAYREGQAEKASWEVAKLAGEIRTFESGETAVGPEATAAWKGFAKRGEDLAREHKSTQAGQWAALLGGKGYLKAGEPKETVRVMEPVLRRITYPLFAGLATELIGYAYLESGEFEKARKTFETLKGIDSPLKEMTPYYLGLVLEREGKATEAREKFDEANTASMSSLFWGRHVRDDILYRELEKAGNWLDRVEK